MGQIACETERWFFYQDAADLWRWARLDLFGAVQAYSSGAFATRDACVDDANRSGYGEERRAGVPRRRRSADRVAR